SPQPGGPAGQGRQDAGVGEVDDWLYPGAVSRESPCGARGLSKRGPTAADLGRCEGGGGPAAADGRQPARQDPRRWPMNPRSLLVGVLGLVVGAVSPPRLAAPTEDPPVGGAVNT